MEKFEPISKNELIKLLKKYNDIEQYIVTLNEQYLEVYTESTKITPSYKSDGSSTGGFNTESKVENNCIKLVEIANKLDKLEEKKKYIDRAMIRLPYYYRKLVRYIDIEDHTIYRASRYFKRDYTAIKRSHEYALDLMLGIKSTKRNAKKRAD